MAEVQNPNVIPMDMPVDPNMPPMMAPAAVPFQNASLYVGDLHPDVTEAYLFDLFNAVGPVQSIRVCRDAVTRRSLGYAYVNFHASPDAERALDTMNYTMIKNRPCRMMWSQRDPALRKKGNGNVFVKHLDVSIDNKALHDTFSLFGNILSCKVVTDHKGKSRGYGFVHFETVEAADEAIKKINGMLLAGKEVFVGKFLKQNERPSIKEWTNVYVKNFPVEWTTEDLTSAFKHCGEIASVIVMKDDDGKGRGFGFVDFADHASAMKAIEEMNEKDLGVEKENEDGEKLLVCQAQKKSDRERDLATKFEQMKMERSSQYEGVNLYVKNLDDKVDDELLLKEFQGFGEITSARVMRDSKTEISRGFGFVCFGSQDEAIKAVQEMNGKLIMGKPIYVALAQRKEQRRVQLESQLRQQQRMMTPQMFPYNNMQMNRQQMQMMQQAMRRNMGNMGMMPRPNMQFANPNARNMPVRNQLSAEALAQASQSDRKSMIGEKLYPKVQAINPQLASKITGMLLEMDNNELLHMLESPEALRLKVEEAIMELQAAGGAR